MVATSLADSPGALLGLETILDGGFGTRDALGRDRAVARLSEIIAYVTLSEEYGRELARLQERSLTQDIDRIRSKYERLGRGIRTLYEHIPYSAIHEASGQRLNAILLTDSVEKLLVLKRYLGLATHEGSEEHVRRVVETLNKILNGSAVMVTTAATLYTEEGAIRGLVYHLKGERLSDLLNGLSNVTRCRSPFLEFTDVANLKAEGDGETHPTARVMKQSIQLATLSDGNAARGAGAKEGGRSSSFVAKRRTLVELKTAEYSLVGNIHHRLGQSPEDVLNEGAGFLSLTDVLVRPLDETFEFCIPYAAVNKVRIQAVGQVSISSARSATDEIYQSWRSERHKDLRPSSVG